MIQTRFRVHGLLSGVRRVLSDFTIRIIAEPRFFLERTRSMTCAPSAPVDAAPGFPIPEALIALVRLLAREAAHADFSARCAKPEQEVQDV